MIDKIETIRTAARSAISWCKDSAELVMAKDANALKVAKLLFNDLDLDIREDASKPFKIQLSFS